MANPAHSGPSPLAFIAVRQHSKCGYFGGLLLLNPLGRPLEFHCTTPIQPTRAQEILYGPTLEAFLCGEQIARGLLAKVKNSPQIVFCDSPAVLSLRHLTSLPVMLVCDAIAWNLATEPLEREMAEIDLRIPRGDSQDLATFSISEFPLAVPANFRQDIASIQDTWSQLEPRLDPREPFARIQEALIEANPMARAA